MAESNKTTLPGAILHSPEIDKLMGALLGVQRVIENVPKRSDNPYFRSKYADLAEVWDTIRDPLSTAQIVALQTVDFYSERTVSTAIVLKQEDGNHKTESIEEIQVPVVGIETTLWHVPSQQWMRQRIEFTPQDTRPQSIGSCLTYGKRYSLLAIIPGMAPDDDDGNRASGLRTTPQQNYEPPRDPKPRHGNRTPPPKTPKTPLNVVNGDQIVNGRLNLWYQNENSLITDKELEIIKGALKKAGYWDEKTSKPIPQFTEYVRSAYNVNKLLDITQEMWPGFRLILENKETLKGVIESVKNGK